MTGLNNYTNRDGVLNRLKREYLEHGKIIIAFDFDNTIYDYHNHDLDLEATICALRKAYKLGMELFCFTANSNHQLITDVVEHLLGIPYQDQKINCCSLDHLFKGRKPFYSILLDDRAGLDSTLRTLHQFMFFVEETSRQNAQ